jgi:hypothetical protein
MTAAGVITGNAVAQLLVEALGLLGGGVGIDRGVDRLEVARNPLALAPRRVLR